MSELSLSISESLRFGFQFWSKHLKTILICGLLVYLPTQIFIELVSVLFTDGTAMNLSDQDLSIMNNIFNVLRFLLGSIATLAILAFTFGKMVNDEELSIQESLKVGFNKWGTFIGASIIAGLKVFVYMLMLIIPGIYKSVRYTFIDCVVITGKSSMVDEGEESEKLVQNNWWNVFWMLVVVVLVQFAIELIMAVPLYFYLDNHLISILGGVGVSLLQSYCIIVRAHYFHTLRSLKTKPLEEVESIGEPMKVEIAHF